MPLPAPADIEVDPVTGKMTLANIPGRLVGSYYTQYPAAASNDYNTAFPAAERPASLFGGTWTVQYESEKLFFRTGGSLAAEADRNNGLQGDAIRNITGSTTFARSEIGLINSDAVISGAFAIGQSLPIMVSNAIAGGRALNFDASRVIPTAAENRPLNRRMIIWKRTA